MNKHDLSGVILRNFVIPVPGVRKKVFYHFSDIHLTVFDALSDAQEREKALQGKQNWHRTRQDFAEAHGEPMEPAQQPDAEIHLSRLLQLSSDGDAVILAGDILDYASPANLRAVEAELEKLSIPVMYVCGNHETIGEIPGGHLYSRVKDPVQVLDFGDLVLLGLDNSQRRISREQNLALQQLLQGEKPLIVAMHIPILCESNREVLEPCGEYFRLNHSEADAETLRFIELVQSNPGKILAVLAGHLHFACSSELVPGLWQHVSSQGILGNINRYEIGI